jgi:CorA-like Mg2+ transporter protein
MKLNLPLDWKLPQVFAARLGDIAGRQRAMAADGHLLLLLHERPQPGVPTRAGRPFWRDAAGQWRAASSDDGLPILKRHVASFAERAEELERAWQDASTAADYFVLLQELAPLHRAVRNLHATLQQARELVPADRDLINLRDQAGEVERTVELLHGDVKNALDFTVAHQAEQQTERTYDMAVSAHRLNLLAAVFLPAATLSAIFGMNLTHGLDTDFPPGALFWSILVIGLITGAYLAQVIARKPEPPTRPAKANTRRR